MSKPTVTRQNRATVSGLNERRLNANSSRSLVASDLWVFNHQSISAKGNVRIHSLVYKSWLETKMILVTRQNRATVSGVFATR
jgi:hypothetical protein